MSDHSGTHAYDFIRTRWNAYLRRILEQWVMNGSDLASNEHVSITRNAKFRRSRSCQIASGPCGGKRVALRASDPFPTSRPFPLSTTGQKNIHLLGRGWALVKGTRVVSLTRQLRFRIDSIAGE
jgi:hypothetical protein